MAIGLYTHIQANRLRSALLLACFAGLFLVLAFALALAFESFGDGALDEIVARACADMIWAAPATLAGVAIWFAIAWRWHARLAAQGTGAEPLRPGDAPRLRHALETLCISRGLPTPRLEIIETDALNAYACGLTQADVTIAVTRGLILALEPDELEAVVAHEVAHILNRDTQLLTIAVIFVGIFGVFGMARHLDAPRSGGRRSAGGTRRDSGRAAALAIAIALVVLAGILARLVRFALSRRREFLADAGAVELTKNPDAMIAALRKIGAASIVPGVSERMAPMFFHAPLAASGDALHETHPTIEERIAALVAYAGGRPDAPPPRQEAAAAVSDRRS